MQSAAQLPERRGNSEHKDRLGTALLDLKCALHLDLEDHMLSLRTQAIDLRARCAVVVAAVFGIFQQPVILDALLKLLLCQEKVVGAVDLALSGLPGRCRD